MQTELENVSLTSFSAVLGLIRLVHVNNWKLLLSHELVPHYNVANVSITLVGFPAILKPY